MSSTEDYNCSFNILRLGFWMRSSPEAESGFRQRSVSKLRQAGRELELGENMLERRGGGGVQVGGSRSGSTEEQEQDWNGLYKERVKDSVKGADARRGAG